MKASVEKRWRNKVDNSPNHTACQRHVCRIDQIVVRERMFQSHDQGVGSVCLITILLKEGIPTADIGPRAFQGRATGITGSLQPRLHVSLGKGRAVRSEEVDEIRKVDAGAHSAVERARESLPTGVTECRNNFKRMRMSSGATCHSCSFKPA